ncbi:MAG TPA: ATP-binding protein [Phnomibacter sp.]|nr:ATP-binding protein [Phnomibacter sp.]
MQTALPSIAALQTFNHQEQVIILLALTPHVQPELYAQIIQEFLPQGGDFAAFGGVRSGNHRGILPTGETAQFVLGGYQMEKRLEVCQLFKDSHRFYRQDILWLEPVREGEPAMSGRIILSQEWVEQLLFGQSGTPQLNAAFPARPCTTQMNWADLVLHPYTAEQIEDIKRWMQHHPQLLKDENLRRKLSPGYRVLFHGPPGTGKTLTAALLGKEFKKEVYRVDLSLIVSKYIGETEKNLGKIFDRAEHRGWILFFDEADSLFGKRTSVQSSHDKYANQEVSYLLQRMDAYEGLLILATNLKTNIDEAFLRRFHSIIHFPMPGVEERLSLWQKTLPSSLPLHRQANLPALAAQYEITGAGILNVVQYATVKALAKQANAISEADLIDGIRREFRKEEKGF